MIFFPAPRYRPRLDHPVAATVRQLCERAGVPCKASGAWCDRGVSWETGPELAIMAEPGYTGQVHVVLPADKARGGRAVARNLLLVLAYGLHDGVAKESVRGVDWARRITPRGRPPALRAKSNAQRQREWRERHARAEA